MFLHDEVAKAFIQQIAPNNIHFTLTRIVPPTVYTFILITEIIVKFHWNNITKIPSEIKKKTINN